MQTYGNLFPGQGAAEFRIEPFCISCCLKLGFCVLRPDCLPADHDSICAGGQKFSLLPFPPGFYQVDYFLRATALDKAPEPAHPVGTGLTPGHGP